MPSARHCSRCGAANVADARFCMACGLSLVRTCSSCGVETQPRARFCVSCGSLLDGGGTAPHGALSLYEERRMVTVLFADLVGYTAVAERLDHETVKGLTDRCLTRLASEVELYGGYVDQYIGDNVMAVFGAPVAHEDDAERAVRAACGMQAAMVELNVGIARAFELELALRVGINTGEVLAGRIGDEYTVVGDAVNIAARLQGAAGVGGILIGERTRRAVNGAGVYREIGPLALKGKAEPVTAWEVVELHQPGRLRTQERAQTKLVGRGAELAQLLRMFERVGSDRSAHLVTVLGEAGVGKSRLVAEFELRCKRRVPRSHVCRGRCLGFGSGAVYWPLSEMLRVECAITSADDGAQAFQKLLGRLGAAGPDEDSRRLRHRLAPLARLFGDAGSEDTSELSEEDQLSARESFFGAVRATFEELARDRVLVIVWEDLHWADEGTLELIEYLAQWLHAPVMQVCLSREDLLERSSNWGVVSRATSGVRLEGLDERDTRRLMEAVAQRAATALQISDALIERSGGNPLFAEALVQRIAEEGADASAELPETVQGLLAARLDSLEPVERQLLCHASVAGRSFSADALEAVSSVSGAELAGAIASLREQELIVLCRDHDEPNEREFVFKHALIRDVAYEMLPKAVRARKHAQVGAFVERRAPDRGELTVALMAEHFARAATLGGEVRMPSAELDGLRRRALEHGEAAGDAAAALFSNGEALARYQVAGAFAAAEDAAGLRITEKSGDVALRLGRVQVAMEAWQRCLAHQRALDDAPRRATLHRKIAAALTHAGDPESAIKQLQRGIRLIGDQPASPELVGLYGEAASLYMRIGANMLASYASERALQVAGDLGEPRAAIRAHGILGRVLGRAGDAAKARESLERAVELARGWDAGETVLALLALGYDLEHCEGDYRGAQARYLEALEVAERIGDVPAQIELRWALAQLAFHRCDWEEVARASDISEALAEGEGLMAKLCLSNTIRGMLRWREGDLDASEQLFTRAHDVAKQVGWSEVSCCALSGLAVTLRDRGDLRGAERVLEQTLALCDQAGLVPQALQTHAGVALVCTLAGRPEAARRAEQQALALAAQCRDPVNEAVVLEAHGIVAEPAEGVEALRRAQAAWESLERPLDAARCLAWIGRRLHESDPQAGDEALSRAATLFEELGVKHLAERSRELVLA
ncbi:MAG TPA: adenylate/guanylate cyclase domain-containing protein [Solirubrobacteraceae bacterium]|nr:adenylate/guanylate cyclase domain-containing protein [Solirubrobacteraceae bacterium]